MFCLGGNSNKLKLHFSMWMEGGFQPGSQACALLSLLCHLACLTLQDNLRESKWRKVELKPGLRLRRDREYWNIPHSTSFPSSWTLRTRLYLNQVYPTMQDLLFWQRTSTLGFSHTESNKHNKCVKPSYTAHMTFLTRETVFLEVGGAVGRLRYLRCLQALPFSLSLPPNLTPPPPPSELGPIGQFRIAQASVSKRDWVRSHWNENHFSFSFKWNSLSQKGFALNLVLKMRGFGTRKWPIGHETWRNN